MTGFLKQSTTVSIRLGPALDKTDGVTEETALSPTVEVSKNHGAFAARNSATAITHDSNGWYAVELNATDTATLGPLIAKFDDAATHLPVWREFTVVPAAVYDALVAGTGNGVRADVAAYQSGLAPLQPTTAGRTLDVTATGAAGIDWSNIENSTFSVTLSNTGIGSVTTAAGIGTGGITTGSFAAGAINAAALATDAITAAKIAADAITAAKLAADVTTEIQTGLATAAAVTTIDDFLDTEIADIQSRLPAALVGGRMNSNIAAVNNVATGVGEWSSLIQGFAASGWDMADAGAGFAAYFATGNIRTGTADSGSTTTMVDAALSQADTDYWKGATIVFTSGTIIGQARLVTAFTPGTDTITFTPATTQAVGTNTYMLIPRAEVRVATVATDAINAAALAADAGTEIGTAVWATTTRQLTGTQSFNLTGNITGNVSGSVGSVTADVGITQSGADKVWGTTTRVLTAGTNINGSTFTAIPWNASWDAEVQSEVEDAIVVHRLDELLNADSDIDGAAPPTVGSVFHELLTKTTGSFTYDQTTDSLEAIRDRGDAAWGAGSVPTVAQIADGVWDEVLSGHLTAGTTGAALNGAGSAGDPWGTTLPGAYGAGTAGKIIGDNINATISSRATPAQVNTEADTALADVGLTTTVTGRIDTAVSTRSSHTAADIWAVGTRALTDKVGFGLANGSIVAATFGAGAIDASAFAQAAADKVWLTTVRTVTGGTVGTLTGHTPQTGDTFARLGAPVGASIAADIATRLATSGYTAPDNAGIASVLTEVQKVPRFGQTYRHRNVDTNAEADVLIETAS